MNRDVLFFFEKKPEALPLYETLEQRILSEISGVSVKVQKTQISFANRHNFAFVSFLPVCKAKERPEIYLVVSFGLNYKVESSRIQVATEPYPNRWTHHMMISSAEEIDDELMGWIREAGAFSAGKRGRSMAKGQKTE